MSSSGSLPTCVEEGLDESVAALYGSLDLNRYIHVLQKFCATY